MRIRRFIVLVEESCLFMKSEQMSHNEHNILSSYNCFIKSLNNRML